MRGAPGGPRDPRDDPVKADALQARALAAERLMAEQAKVIAQPRRQEQDEKGVSYAKG